MLTTTNTEDDDNVEDRHGWGREGVSLLKTPQETSINHNELIERALGWPLRQYYLTLS